VQPATVVAAFVAGFIVAEAVFTASPPRKFRFAVALGGTDRQTCIGLRSFFGVGAVHDFPRRRPHYDDEVSFQVQSIRELVTVVVPFMDEHLPPSHKREQYLTWRAALLDYWEHHAQRRRPCTIEGCEQPQRAKRLCRHHYYLAFGR
jgi:hypothetical protein